MKRNSLNLILSGAALTVVTMFSSGDAFAGDTVYDRCYNPDNWAATPYSNNAGVQYSRCGTPTATIYMHPTRENKIKIYTRQKPGDYAEDDEYGFYHQSCNGNFHTFADMSEEGKNSYRAMSVKCFKGLMPDFYSERRKDPGTVDPALEAILGHLGGL